MSNPTSFDVHPAEPPKAAEHAALTKGDAAMEQSLLQTRFVQNALPFLASLLFHVGIVVLGVATYQAVKAATKPAIPDYTIPTAEPLDGVDAPPVVLPNRGLHGTDPLGGLFQDKLPDVPIDSRGISDTRGTELWALEGNAGDSTDSIIGIGPKGSLGNAKGDGFGNAGAPAPFGVPGIGDPIGSDVFIKPPRDVRCHRIVFVCDATGSMMEHFDDLRSQLRKVVAPLKASVSCNIVFIQEHAAPPIDGKLLAATPDNKRRLMAYVDNYTARGPTEPLPAFKAALAMNPDLMYVLCDPSDFKDCQALIDLCRSASASHKLCINTICFEAAENQDMLKQIAANSGGKYRNLTAKELADE